MQDAYCPEELHTLLVNEFAEKYGKNFAVRGRNFSKNLVEQAWLSYSNNRGLLECFTHAQVTRTFQISSESTSQALNKTLEAIRRRPLASDGQQSNTNTTNAYPGFSSFQTALAAAEKDRTWNRERVRICAESLQHAADQLKELFIEETERQLGGGVDIAHRDFDKRTGGEIHVRWLQDMLEEADKLAATCRRRFALLQVGIVDSVCHLHARL